MSGDNSDTAPPDSISNSEVKRISGDGSVGFPHVRVAHRQASILLVRETKARSLLLRAFLCGIVRSWGNKLKRQYCEKCAYPLITCVCKAIVKVILPLRVVILQHEKESKHAKNTARLAKLISPEIEIVKLTKDLEKQDLVNSLKMTNAIVLYPNETSTPLESFSIKSTQSQLHTEYLDKNTTLILIDGSWKQAYGIWQEHTWLKDLPHCHFGELPDKQYKIRKSKKTHQLSTIEALAQSIEILCKISGKPYISLFNHMQAYWEKHTSQ